jgi:large-conductance mechanosensitive channel
MFFDSWLRYLSPQQLIDMSTFKKFLLDNNIIATTAGVLIAYSAWDFIQSFVGDLILPGFYFLFISRFISNKFVSSIFEPMNRLNLSQFFTRLISFIVVIIFTFLFIQHIIKNWLTDIATTTSSPPIEKGNVFIQSSFASNAFDKKGDSQYSNFTIQPI